MADLLNERKQLYLMQELSIKSPGTTVLTWPPPSPTGETHVYISTSSAGARTRARFPESVSIPPHLSKHLKMIFLRAASKMICVLFSFAAFCQDEIFIKIKYAMKS